MRLFLFAVLAPILCIAQAPTIGVVEIYGARKTSLADIRKVAGVAPGARLPASKAIIEEDLVLLRNVAVASLEAACCQAGKVILYIGIAEKDSRPLTFRDDPVDGPDIPERVTVAYQRFLAQTNEAGRAGVAGEELTQGHSLMAFAPARAVQETFVELANEFASELREVVRKSPSEDHRAMAAYVLGYHKDKSSVVADLMYALRDGDATVRGNAARALAAIGVYAERNPSAGIQIDASLLAEMLNSAVWTDRNNAAVALVSMTESRNAATLATVRKHALHALVEMARWQHLPHALPAYILLGRTAGMDEGQLQDSWSKGERERIIVRAAASGSAPSRTRSTPPGRP